MACGWFTKTSCSLSCPKKYYFTNYRLPKLLLEKKNPPVLFANFLLVAGKCNLTKKGIISQSLRVKVVLCIINLGFIFHSNSIFYFFSP